MAKYNFNLRDPNSVSETAIHLVIRYNTKRLVFPIGETIKPVHWNPKKQRVKEENKFPEHPEFNQRLEDILTLVKSTFRKYQNEHNQQRPTIAVFRELLKIELNGVQELTKLDLFGFIELHIKQSKKTNPKANVNTHKQTLKRLKEFARRKKQRIDFDTIDLDFYHDFVDFLTHDANYALNTIGKQIQNLKVFLNAATERGLNTNMAYKSKRFKKVSEEVDNIYLNEKELDEMYQLDLSTNQRLERVRDLFIVGCWTGLRFSDFSNIKSENIDGDFIEIGTQKTGETVVIPIHWTIKKILNKYKGKYPNSLPPAISNTKMNDYLKEVAQQVESLQNTFSKGITKGGTKRFTSTEKYKLVSSHTARRSMATNLFISGFPSISIMKITGHRTETAFLKYIKVTPKENAELLRQHWQKKTKLKAV